MKDKKKSKRFSFLIYFFILILAIFLIYFIVNQMNQRYTTIATSDMVSMVYDEGDDNNVLSFEAIQNGDETTLNVQFIDNCLYSIFSIGFCRKNHVGGSWKPFICSCIGNLFLFNRRILVGNCTIFCDGMSYSIC